MNKVKYDGEHKREDFKMKSLHLENLAIPDADRRMLNQLVLDRRFLDRRLFDRRLLSPQLRDGFPGEDRRSHGRRANARRTEVGKGILEFSHKRP